MSTIDTSKEAMKLALEALEDVQYYGWGQTERDYDARTAAITALREALAKQSAQHEPVARQYQGRDGVWKDFISEKHYKATLEDGSWPIRNLYTSPPAQRKPLTDEQREEIAKGWRGRNWTVGGIIDAIEAVHGIKENT